MRQQKSNKGFTLIELLIVIAIIGILAAVLIPNLLSARKRAYDTATQSYLREVATSQESNYIDVNTYAVTGSLTDPVTLPANVTVSAEFADTTSYCVSAQHSGNAGVVFKITPGSGIQKVDATATPAVADCTSAAG